MYLHTTYIMTKLDCSFVSFVLMSIMWVYCTYSLFDNYVVMTQLNNITAKKLDRLKKITGDENIRNSSDISSVTTDDDFDDSSSKTSSATTDDYICDECEATTHTKYFLNNATQMSPDTNFVISLSRVGSNALLRELKKKCGGKSEEFDTALRLVCMSSLRLFNPTFVTLVGTQIELYFENTRDKPLMYNGSIEKYLSAVTSFITASFDKKLRGLLADNKIELDPHDSFLFSAEISEYDPKDDLVFDHLFSNQKFEYDLE
jgi:hypothetical protein